LLPPDGSVTTIDCRSYIPPTSRFATLKSGFYFADVRQCRTSVRPTPLVDRRKVVEPNLSPLRERLCPARPKLQAADASRFANAK